MAAIHIFGETNLIEKFKIKCGECGSENANINTVISDYFANYIAISCDDCNVTENVYSEVKDEIDLQNAIL